MRASVSRSLLFVAIGASLLCIGAGTITSLNARAPFVRDTLCVDPDTQAADYVKSTNNPAASRTLIKEISDTPTARWFGEWNENIPEDMGEWLTDAQKRKCLPVGVLYNIPERDAGQYSTGGKESAQAYRQWIDAIAQIVGARKVIFILEPDALSDLELLTILQQDERLSLLRYAVDALSKNPNVYLYIDAGNAKWHPATVMIDRLKKAGVEKARGFSLNVSNFITDAESVRYGRAILRGLRGKHFVVDRSRNGNGSAPDGNWCNPPGRALGEQPTLRTRNTSVDAYLWIKHPFESDGDCEVGNPDAGDPFPWYAEELVKNRAAKRAKAAVKK